MKTVNINLDEITDSSSFHQIFMDTIGFPEFYGKNMNAWIDCMGYMSQPESGMTEILLTKEEVLILNLINAESFKERCPNLYMELIECSAFVNHRLLNQGHSPVLLLAFSV